jgi:hypothetical protein
MCAYVLSEIGCGYSYGGNVRQIYQKWIQPYETYITVRRKKDPSLPSSPVTNDIFGPPDVQMDDGKDKRTRRASASKNQESATRPRRKSSGYEMKKSPPRKALPEGYVPQPGEEVRVDASNDSVV